MKNLQNIFKNKTILITGHTGFKGSWLSLWLHNLGANIVGLSNGIPSNPSNFEECSLERLVQNNFIDVCDKKKVQRLVQDTQPDFVFHLAAQALVMESYKSPINTFTTNAIGTASILDAFRNYEKKVNLIMITSDKAYDNVEQVWGYKETDLLGGKDPYSASKGMAELVLKSYFHSYFKDVDSNVRIGIARAGNVIGGGDWASNRIVADCIRSWSEDKIVEIRNPNATRPWQHVLEPLSGYLTLAMKLSEGTELHGEAYNFGPSAEQNFSVKSLIDEMRKSWKNVRWKDTSDEQTIMHEAGLLKLNCDKALFDLQWLPTMDFSETVKLTVDWYKAFYDLSDTNMQEYSISQINKYTSLAQKRHRVWTNH